MRKIFVVIILLVFVLLPSLTEAADDRWVWMFSDDKTGYFFDSATIAPSENSRNVFVVWIKLHHTQARAQELGRQFGLDKDFSYSLNRYRFDINNRRLALIAVTDYDTNGNVLYSQSFKEYLIEWHDILPDTVAEGWFMITKEYYLSK